MILLLADPIEPLGIPQMGIVSETACDLKFAELLVIERAKYLASFLSDRPLAKGS
jgi:hypothetical protein